MTERVLSGTLVYGDDFEEREGYIVIEGTKIKEIGEGKVEAALAKGIIIPSFINAHTHIGDSVLKEPNYMSLEKLVGPEGFKYKILAETSYNTLVSSMKDTIEDIFATGTQLIADFREGGISGAEALKKACNMAFEAYGQEELRVRLFGRPIDGSEDLNRLFDLVDGIGMSSVADHPQETLTFLAEEARRRKKLFALHAGERNADDIQGAIDLEPDFLVHLIHASPQDFTGMHDAGIAAVICIRSNLVTGVGLPPLAHIIESGLTVGVGTDNVMLNSPDMFSEMEIISKLFHIDEREVLKMCTLNAAQILKEGDSIGSIEEGKKANLVVIRDDTPNMRNVMSPIKGVVRRATRNDIAAVMYEGEVVK
jgi:cytosine/adenosine deaminase-related metal-dependent hydrolase